MAAASECVSNTLQNYFIGAITFASVQAGGIDYLFALLKPFIPQSIYYILFFFMCGFKIAFRMCLQKFYSGVAYTKTYLHDMFFVVKEEELKENEQHSDDDDNLSESETESQLEQCSDALITEPKNASTLLTMRKPRNFEKELGSSMLFK